MRSFSVVLGLERDDVSKKSHPALSFCLSMIFSGKPVPTFPDHALVLLSQKVADQRSRNQISGRFTSAAGGLRMDRRGFKSSESRFAAYVEGLGSVIGHKDREQPLRDYCTGLMLRGERKSVEPIAAVTAPARVAAQHQSLLHFVG